MAEGNRVLGQSNSWARRVPVVGMVVAVALLMPYDRVSRVWHEYLGLMMAVFIVYHVWRQRRWLRSWFVGRYTPYRLVQTVLAVGAAVCMVASLLSAVVISELVFPKWPLLGWHEPARMVHLAGAYWGLLFLGLHGGLHTALPGRFKVSAITNVVVRWISRLVIAVAGVLAFVKLDVFSYMTFQVHFAWNGDGMSAPVTVVAYALVFGLYAVVGNLLGHGCMLNTKRK